MRLYEITDAYNEIMALVEQAEGEITEDQIAELDKIEDSLKDKVDNIAHIICNLEAFAKQCKEEAERLKALQKSRVNNAARLREYLLFQFQKTNTKKIDTNTHTIATRKNPPSVQIDKIDEIPLTLQNAKLSITADLLPEELKNEADILPDKTAIKKHIQANGPVSWAHLEQKESISIR